MEEKRVFKTYVQKSHNFGNNDYVLGVINGISLVICGRDVNESHVMESTEEYYIISVTCTKDQFMEFTRVVGQRYGDLCIFQIN